MGDASVWNDEHPFEKGKLACRSCPRDLPMVATHFASPKRTDGVQSPTEWPLCEGHLPYAMVAGWFPIEEIHHD